MADEGELGLILQYLKDLRQDLQDEREVARASRAETHKRIDDVVARISHLDTTQAIAGEIESQMRDRLDAFGRRLDIVEPVVTEWNGLIKAGRRVSWFIGISGLVTGAGLIAAFQWAGDSIVNFIRHLLRLQ